MARDKQAAERESNRRSGDSVEDKLGCLMKGWMEGAAARRVTGLEASEGSLKECGALVDRGGGWRVKVEGED